jgi:hypothetical protein
MNRKSSVASDRRRLAARWGSDEGRKARARLLRDLRAGRRPSDEGATLGVRSYPGQGRLDLRRVDLSGETLGGADLSQADLQGANLARSSLVGANLAGANLREALLRRTDLTGADLTGADLRGAVLEDVVLEHAEMAGVQLSPESRVVRANPLEEPSATRSKWFEDADPAELGGHDPTR